jgi:hypothetical protein
MRYKFLYDNKWLDTRADIMYSDGRDEDLWKRYRIIKIIEDKHKYPEDYIDWYYYGKKNSGDLSNRSLKPGFHKIVLCDGDPNSGGKILPSYGPECLRTG